MKAVYGRLVDVAMLRWPAESDRRDDLATLGVPRLLLVEPGSPPPPLDDCLEDWLRVPADEADAAARIAALERRADAHTHTHTANNGNGNGNGNGDIPHLDEDGVLRFDGRWVALPPVEGRLAALLIDRFGAVVSRDALTKAGWPSTPSGRNALDVHILRLRRRLSQVGLSIRTVRSRGYLLEA
jgi:DNA-binding response OmpR family regulator